MDDPRKADAACHGEPEGDREVTAIAAEDGRKIVLEFDRKAWEELRREWTGPLCLKGRTETWWTGRWRSGRGNNAT